MNALPSPKPNRRRRLALRIAVLDVAVSVLGAAYWFTRPPELVWWTSPPIDHARHHVKLLVPDGWIVEPLSAEYLSLNHTYRMIPSDRRPQILRWFLPANTVLNSLTVGTTIAETVYDDYTPTEHIMYARGIALAYHKRWFPDQSLIVVVRYSRSNRGIFDNTHSAIWNSLRIE